MHEPFKYSQPAIDQGDGVVSAAVAMHKADWFPSAYTLIGSFLHKS
jgi:hypothetical protein